MILFPLKHFGYTVLGIHDGGVTNNPNYQYSDTLNTLNIDYEISITKMTITTI